MDRDGAQAARRLTRREALARAASLAAGAAAVGVLGSSPAWAGRKRLPPVHRLGADVATRWFDLSLRLVRGTAGYSPPVASRAFGCAGITLYEALVPGMRGFRSLGRLLRGPLELPREDRRASYDWELVANAALAGVFRGLFPTAPADLQAAVSELEAAVANDRRGATRQDVFDRSVERGRAVAAAIFAWSRADGGHEGYLRNFPPYTPPVGPGLWVPTPPGFQPALQPFWGRNRCIAIEDGSSAPAGDHPSYSEQPGSAFYREALEVFDTVNALTAEQLAIARFWSDDPGATSTPPGHSISIATQVLLAERADLADAAETYAKVGIAVSDAFVACWQEKYAYNLLRPVTYIQRLLDADWLPVLVTPPFPEYPSGHSTQSGAAFTVLADLFGKRHSFTDHTHDDRGLPPRSFRSFDDAAEEAALSRLYGGIHHRAAIDNGLAQGRSIARAVKKLPFHG
jgi:PAP2 superfamily